MAKGQQISNQYHKYIEQQTKILIRFRETPSNALTYRPNCAKGQSQNNPRILGLSYITGRHIFITVVWYSFSGEAILRGNAVKKINQWLRVASPLSQSTGRNDFSTPPVTPFSTPEALLDIAALWHRLEPVSHSFSFNPLHLL